MKESEDEDDIEDAEDIKSLAQRLLEVLPQVFTSSESESEEPSILFHDDLSFQNILIDDDGKMVAVIDWECVSALPLWRACQFPAFLEGRAREGRTSP